MKDNYTKTDVIKAINAYKIKEDRNKKDDISINFIEDAVKITSQIIDELDLYPKGKIKCHAYLKK